jgi:DNA-binding LacI/PurR family transcriptional regulator
MVDRSLSYMVDITHLLREAGHTAFYAEKTLVDLTMNPKRIAILANHTPADAWVVTSGSHDVLKYFANGPKPAFALFGATRGLRIAATAPDKKPAIAEATRTLIGHGHTRIALLARPRRRLPFPGGTEQAFLDELQAHGIQPAPYHLPDWEDNPGSFHAMLEAMFRVTPPTALIVEEAAHFVAVMQFGAARRIRVPEDLSLICTDADPAFDWCPRSVAHIDWDNRPIVRRVIQWAENVSRGKADLRQTFSSAKFILGGTVAAVSGHRKMG